VILLASLLVFKQSDTNNSSIRQNPDEEDFACSQSQGAMVVGDTALKSQLPKTNR